jgi:prepilin-type N-terminal cleavage/methylation domain-containing protein
MTLIEVLVVMVIMAAMAAAAAVGVMRSWNTARKHDTATRARTIQAAATAIHVRSPGPDATFGTEDDIGF